MKNINNMEQIEINFKGNRLTVEFTAEDYQRQMLEQEGIEGGFEVEKVLLKGEDITELVEPWIDDIHEALEGQIADDMNPY